MFDRPGESHVRFVHEPGGVERLAAALAPELRACDSRERRVDLLDQPLAGAFVAATPRPEQRRDISGLGGRASTPGGMIRSTPVRQAPPPHELEREGHLPVDGA